MRFAPFDTVCFACLRQEREWEVGSLTWVGMDVSRFLFVDVFVLSGFSWIFFVFTFQMASKCHYVPMH
jgi:hypothetical protein